MTDTADEPRPWSAFVLDRYGFVLSEDSNIVTDLRAYVGRDADDESWDHDSAPGQIVIARGSAYPRPQFPGSDILRSPGSHKVADQITLLDSIEESEDPDYVVNVWLAAIGAAAYLNKIADSR
jgi:hypothetical protein